MSLVRPYNRPHSCELRLIGAHIDGYDQGNLANHEPDRDRKLPMKCGEIDPLRQSAREGPDPRNIQTRYLAAALGLLTGLPN